MLTPSVFGKDFFEDFDDMFNFPFWDDRDMKKIEKKLDLPGFQKDEIKVALENGYLTISAARGLDKDEQDKKTSKYIRKERYAGACQRSFYVGDTVKQEDIKGEFKHGILKLTIPKKEAEPEVEASKYITIE